MGKCIRWHMKIADQTLWLVHIMTNARTPHEPISSSSDWCALQETLCKCIDTIQYYTIQYNTIGYNTILYNTIQNNTIQYNTIRFCCGGDKLITVCGKTSLLAGKWEHL